jgi:carbonic anhydrase/acetyltransferase-like protein (isoleucine patch superfamily)
MTDTFDFQDGRGPVPAHKHPNGGGWVADTATVSDTAYVGPDAWVSGNAQVYGSALVSGSAQVYGHAQVYGSAQVSGSAQVYGSAWVYDNAQVYGSARVYGSAQVYDNAWVYGSAQVYDNAWVYGNARVKRGEYTVTPISITRSDGYTFTLQSDGSIVAGCRDFTPQEADEYWGNPSHHRHAESMAIVNALRAIDAARKGDTP